MGPGTQFKTWGSALDDACKKIANYGPDALVISLGVDTFENDPISFFKLTSDDFLRYGATIGAVIGYLFTGNLLRPSRCDVFIPAR